MSGRTFYTPEKPQADTQAEPQLPKIQSVEQGVESALQSSIHAARTQLQVYLDKSKEAYITQSQKYFEAEREVNKTIANLHDRREDLLPNAIYIITGSLLGSIVTRRSNVFLKVAAPVAFGVASFKYFMPLTFDRTFSFASDIQKEQLPTVYQKQNELINKADELVKQTTELAESQQNSVHSFLNSTKRTIAEWTGLNIDQVVTEKKK